MSKDLSRIESLVAQAATASQQAGANGSSFITAIMLATLVTVLSGCELIGNLLKLGFWTGVIVVVIVVVVIMAVMRFFRRRL